jgi:membrane protein
MPGQVIARIRGCGAPVRRLLLTAPQRVLQHAWVRQGVLLMRRSSREFLDDHCQQMAAAISYHLLFSLFPLAIAVVGVIGLISQNAHAGDAVSTVVLKVVPLSAHGKHELRTALASARGGAGALGLVGIIGVIWSATGVMAAIRTALNVAWDTEHHRPFIRGKIVDLMQMGCIFLVVAAALGITVLASFVRRGGVRLPGALAFAQPLAGAATAAAVYLAAAAVLFVTFLLLYRFVPAAPTRLRDIWPGALAAAAGFEAVQYGFSVYVTYFSHYNKVYGSLGAVIALMFFVYLASAVLLFGAEIASEYPRLPGNGAGGQAPRPP